MKKSVWVIAILGVLTFALLMLGMHLTLSALQTTAAGSRVKLSNQIQNHFEFGAVSVNRESQGQRKLLVVMYETEKTLNHNQEAEEKEMKTVGEYVFENCTPEDRAAIDQVTIHRHEILASGCDKQVHKSEFKVINPDIEKFFEDE